MQGRVDSFLAVKNYHDPIIKLAGKATKIHDPVKIWFKKVMTIPTHDPVVKPAKKSPPRR